MRLRRTHILLLIAGLPALSASFLLLRRAATDPLASAQRCFESGDFPSAFRLAQAEVVKHPDDSQRASLLAARSLTRLGQSDRAEIYYARAGELRSDDLHERAYGLILLNQPERASTILNRILAGSPSDPLALQRLAAIRIVQARYAEAAELARRLSGVPGHEVRGATLLGSALYQWKSYEPAIAAYLRVLELDPTLEKMPLSPGQFWNDLALSLMAVGRSAEARLYLDKALERSRDANLMELLGLSHHQNGNIDEAERCWRQAVLWDPDLADAWLNLGRLLLQRRHPEEAIPMFLRAAELSPQSLEPLYNLSQANRQLGRHEEAESYDRLAEQRRAR